MNEIKTRHLEYHEMLQKLRTNPVANQGLEDFFTTHSGDKLFFRAWYPENIKAIVLAIHGLAAHGEYFVQVADQVIEHEIAVFAIDLKGHGRSSGNKGDNQRL